MEHYFDKNKRMQSKDRTVMPDGRVYGIGWDAPNCPNESAQDRMLAIANSIGGEKVAVFAPAQGGLKIVVTDGGPTRTFTVAALVDAYLGASGDSQAVRNLISAAFGGVE